MREKSTISLFVSDFFHGLKAYKKAYEFIRENRLWEGAARYKGAVALLILIGLVLGLKVFDITSNFVQSDKEGPVLASTMGMVKDVASESYNFLFLGGMKYLVLIFLEIIIFHFVRKTLEIKTGKQIKVTFKQFLNAEMRMIKVVILSFIMESIITVLIGIGLEISGMVFLKPLLVFLVQAYFLGFVFIDNYNELSKVTIRESERMTRQYAGVSIAIGIVSYVLLVIPIIGSIAAPVLGGVAATLAMFDMYKPNLEELVPEVEIMKNEKTIPPTES